MPKRTNNSKASFHAIKVMRDIFESGKVARLGSDVFAFVCVIGLTEDKIGYRGPVSFWNLSLASMLGWSPKKLKNVRQRACDAGVVKYRKGKRHQAPQYEVVRGDEMTPQRDCKGDSEGSSKGPRRGSPSSLIPKPNTPPCSDRETGGDLETLDSVKQKAIDRWERHVRELGKGFSPSQRQVIEARAQSYDAVSLNKIVDDHIERGRYTFTWPEKRRQKRQKLTPEEKVDKERYLLIKKYKVNDARNWPADKVTAEVKARTAPQANKNRDS